MLTDKQKIAIILLRNGEKVQTVAFACGVHRCTIWRWFKKKDIGRRFRLFCKLDYQRTFGASNLMEIWHQYETHRDALISAITEDNRRSVEQMYSVLIDDYYRPLGGVLEARMASRRRRNHVS